MNCGEPTLFTTISTRAMASGPHTSTSSGRDRARQSSRATPPRASGSSTSSNRAAPRVPGPIASQVLSFLLSTIATSSRTSEATAHGLAVTDSIWSPRAPCANRKLATFRRPPPATTAATTHRLTRAPGRTTSRRGRRAIITSGSSRAPGATLIQAPTVSRVTASCGRRAARRSATITTGATIASIRPIATGPSSRRNASHHHAAPVPPRRTSAQTATASSAVTSAHQVNMYAVVESVPTRPAGTSIGTSAPTG